MAPTYVSTTTATQATTAVGTTGTSFSVAVVGGQTLVLKIATGDAQVKVTGVSDNAGNTWELAAGIDSHASYSTAYVYTAFAATTATISISVALTNAAAGTGYPQAYALERWTSAMVATTPATSTDWWSSTTQSTITTAGTDSTVTWVESDWLAKTGTATYGAATVTGTAYRGTALNAFFAQQSAASPGSKTYGMTAPAGMKVTNAALELLTAQRTNLCPNPSFEVSTTGWVSLGAGGTTVSAVGRISTTAPAGSYMAYVSAYGAGSAYVRFPLAPVTAGVSYTAAIIKPDTASGNIGIDWLNSSGAQVGTSPTGTASSAYDAQLTVTGTAPTGAVQARPFLYETIPASATSGSPQFVFFDAAQLELAATWSSTYFDGSTDSTCSWTGATGLSASWTTTPPSTTYPGAVNLAGTSSLTAAATSSTPAYQGQATLVAVSSLSVSGPAETAVARSTLAGTSTVTATAWVTEKVAAVLAGLSGGSFAALPPIAPAAAVLVAVSGSSLTALPPIAPAAAALAGTSHLTIGAFVAEQSVASLHGTSALVISGEKFTPPFIIPTGPPVPPVPNPVIRLLLADTMTGRVGYELPWETLQWSSTLNSTGTVQAELAVERVFGDLYEQGADDPATVMREFLTGPWRYSLAVTYGNDVLWAGPYLPSQDPPDKPTVTIQGVEFAKIFDRRLVYSPNYSPTALWADPSFDLTLTGTTLPGIVYSLVQNAITSNSFSTNRALPITCANPPDGMGQEGRTYYGYDLSTTTKALADIINADGGPDVRFDPYLYQGSTALYLAWELRIGTPTIDTAPVYTWDDTIATVQRDIDASAMATGVWVPGNGQDRAKVIGWATDVPDSPFSLSGRGFPTLESVDSNHSSETDINGLESWADADQYAAGQAVDTWTLTVPIDGDPPGGTYHVGDVSGIDIANHLVIPPGTYRRRITGLSGDGSPWVQIVCSDVDAQASS